MIDKQIKRHSNAALEKPRVEWQQKVSVDDEHGY
ncbi:hypothetical protein SAMN04487787_107103 [Kosakonia sacchari]|nr:hypothetical protein SAMN04487787_107103 [Kosakonia sacchari]